MNDTEIDPQEYQIQLLGYQEEASEIELHLVPFTEISLEELEL